MAPMSTGARSAGHAVLQEGLSDEVAGERKTELNEKTPKISAWHIPGRGHSLCGGPEVAAGLCVAAVSERAVEGRSREIGQGDRGPDHAGHRGPWRRPCFYPGGDGAAAGDEQGSTNTGVTAGNAPAVSQAPSGTNSLISSRQTKEPGPDARA